MLKKILAWLFPSEEQVAEKIRLEKAKKMMEEGVPLNDIIKIINLREDEIDKL